MRETMTKTSVEGEGGSHALGDGELDPPRNAYEGQLVRGDMPRLYGQYGRLYGEYGEYGYGQHGLYDTSI